MDKNNINKSSDTHSNLSAIQKELLELVQKNKRIPDFLNKLMPDNPRLVCLKKAINKGNFRAHIWNHPECNLYLIYLIQKNIIPFWHGITAYVYLIAKMQYTKTQNLRKEDEDVKCNYLVHIVPLVKSGKITELGYHYLLCVTQNLGKLNIYLNFDQLIDFVLKLPRIEQWLILSEFDQHNKQLQVKYDANRLIWVLINNLPLIARMVGSFDDPTLQYLVPSSSMINYFLQILNQHPMRMRPILGNPGLETLYHWHAQDFHPVSLYATQILSNPKHADGYRCGPFPMWLHDIGHTFWASMLTKQQRDYIYTTYIPAIRWLKAMAIEYDDILSSELLKEVEIRAYDFDLTAILDYADIEKRFDIYLAHTLGKNPIYPTCLYNGVYEFEKIGLAEGDTFYFLLHYAAYLDKTPEAYKNVYQTLIGFITTGPTYRSQRIVNALKTVAKNAAAQPYALFATDTFPLWWGHTVYWQSLFKSDRNSETLWNEMLGDEDLAEELTDMIERGLIFFPPYLPMTATKKWAMLFYLESQLEFEFGTKSSNAAGCNDNIEATFDVSLANLTESDASAFSYDTQCYPSQTLGFWQVPVNMQPPELNQSYNENGLCCNEVDIQPTRVYTTRL